MENDKLDITIEDLNIPQVPIINNEAKNKFINESPKEETLINSGRFFNSLPNSEIQQSQTTQLQTLIDPNLKYEKLEELNNDFSQIDTSSFIKEAVKDEPSLKVFTKPKSLIAIVNIREAVAELSKTGINIEIEELDLGFEYQINLKIKTEDK